MPWLIVFSILFATPQAKAITPTDLKSGDVLLQSVSCYLCSMIESEEGLPYSHVGVILKNEVGIAVLESWNGLQKISLDQHLSLRRKGTLTLVRRPLNLEGDFLKIRNVELDQLFRLRFAGHHYDSDFLWNNADSAGETFYCSEFSAKILDFFLPESMPTKAMHFIRHRSDWLQYFHGNPPDGKPGISPADFARSVQFTTIGTL